MNNTNNNRTKVKLIQLLIFTPLIYMLFNAAMNYLFQTLKLLTDFKNPDKHLDFKLSYLISCKGMDWYMMIMISLVAAMLLILKLEQNWQIKNGNKNIKGEAHFLEVKDVEKILYGVDENNISKAEKSGIPLYRENGKIYMDSETIHSLIIGTTRSGKGQTFVMPMIRFICNSQSKHSMVINDPKGEMLENCYDMLVDNGYDIVVINLRDTQWSNLWNPLQIIIDEYKDRRDGKDGRTDMSRVMKLCQSLADVFTHNDKSDPIWPESAKSLFVAMLLYLLEQGYDNGHLENVSLYSLFQMFVDFGEKNEARKVNGAMRDLNALDELFKQLPTGNPAKSAYATSNFASGEMRSSIFSTLASNLTLFGSDEGVSKLTSGNQINFRALANPDKPMALFMLIPDEDTSRYVLASLFITQCYDQLVEYSSSFRGQKLPQRVHFILDEFGNLVHIPGMDTKITVGAGRNLLFNLFVQDLNQLDSKYSEASKTIRSNCGNMVYINSLDKDTNEYFSAILGNKTIEYNTYSGDLSAFIAAQNHQSGAVDQQPLMTADKLSNLEPGTAVVKRQRSYPMITKFEFFYKLGIQPHSIESISKRMTLIDKPLTETIYPLDEIWAQIIKRTSVGEAATAQKCDWKEQADKLLAMPGIGGGNKWVWQVQSTSETETIYKLTLRTKTKTAVKTNFTPTVVIHSEVEEALKRIKEKNPTAFFEIDGYINQLHEATTDDKVKIAEKALAILKRETYLNKNEKNVLTKHINGLHNGK